MQPVVETQPTEVVPTEVVQVIPQDLPGRPANPLEQTLLAAARMNTPVRVAPDRSMPTTRPTTRPAKTPAETVDAALRGVRAGVAPIRAAATLVRLDRRTADTLLIAPLLDPASPFHAEAIALLNEVATPATVLKLIEAGEAYDEAADRWTLREPVIAAIARIVPADLLADEIARPTMAGDKGHVLMAALAQCDDTAAGDYLLRLAESEPAAARLATSRASNAVAWQLLQHLGSRRIEDRHLAAWLLSAVDQAWVYGSLEAALTQPALRDAAMRTLLLAKSPTSVAIIQRASRQTHLRSLIRLLAAEDLRPPMLRQTPPGEADVPATTQPAGQDVPAEQDLPADEPQPTADAEAGTVLI